MIKIGIVGSGFGLYGLLPAFNSTKGAKVAAICGKKTHRLLNYCKSIGLKKIYTDWQVMLMEEKLDAIALAVIPKAQYKIAKVAIGRNLHIFAEKPLAATYVQAKELLRLATKKKIIHAIDFIFPEIEEWKKVKQLIDKKSFGKLKYISINWDFLSYDIKNKIVSWKTNVVEGGGALSFYFSHALYYLEYFAGQITDIKSLLAYSNGSTNSGEVGVDLLLKFKNNIKGYSHLRCDASGLNRHQLIFHFEKGIIILENENSITDNFIIKIYTGTKIDKLYLPKKRSRIGDEDERVRVVKRLAAKFVNSCIQGKPMIPSFKEGVRVQELIEKIRLNS